MRFLFFFFLHFSFFFFPFPFRFLSFPSFSLSSILLTVSLLLTIIQQLLCRQFYITDLAFWCRGTAKVVDQSRTAGSSMSSTARRRNKGALTSWHIHPLQTPAALGAGPVERPVVDTPDLPSSGEFPGLPFKAGDYAAITRTGSGLADTKLGARASSPSPGMLPRSRFPSLTPPSPVRSPRVGVETRD